MGLWAVGTPASNSVLFTLYNPWRPKNGTAETSDISRRDAGTQRVQRFLI